MRILFANIGWMAHYRGNNAKDQPAMVIFIWDELQKAWLSDRDPSIKLSIELKPSYLAVVE
jgi:hypothetical protein